MRTRSRSGSVIAAPTPAEAADTAGPAIPSPASAPPSPNPRPAHDIPPPMGTRPGNVTLADAANSYGTRFFTVVFVGGPGRQRTAGGQAAPQAPRDGTPTRPSAA